MYIRRALMLLLSIALLTGVFSGCKNGANIKEPQKQAESFYDYFDTVSVIISYAGDTPDAFKANADAVSSLLGEYHKLFDIYYEYADINNLKTVNKNAGKAPVTVDSKLIDFLLYAKEIYTLTCGVTNIAMGSVLTLWHNERENADTSPENAKIPSPDALTDAARHTDINNLIIDRENSTVYLSDPEMSLDVGALGKGYATEKAAELLISRGASSYVLNIGGNIRAIGEKVTGDGWVTGITNPDKTSEESFVCKVVLKNTSLVTSGDYERYYTVDGVKYHHVIDPKTNMPASYFSSVSVFTLNSALADALSTALFCMSYDEGKALVAAIGGVDVVWVTPSGELFSTEGVSFYKD